jgi:hypothetical protein
LVAIRLGLGHGVAVAWLWQLPSDLYKIGLSIDQHESTTEQRWPRN